MAILQNKWILLRKARQGKNLLIFGHDFQTQLFPINLKCPICKKKYIYFFENQLIGLRFSIVDRNASDAPQKKHQVLKNFGRKSGRGCGGSVLIFFTKVFFSKFLISRRQKSPLDGATDFQIKIRQHITTVSFVSAFIFVFARKPKKCLYTCLNGENNFVHFKHVCWFLFIHSWSRIEV